MNAVLRDVVKRPAKSHAWFYIFDPLNTALISRRTMWYSGTGGGELKEFFADGARRLASMGLCKCLW
jgi:hypothetical protein